jgi:hypothetical protein
MMGECFYDVECDEYNKFWEMTDLLTTGRTRDTHSENNYFFDRIVSAHGFIKQHLEYTHANP